MHDWVALLLMTTLAGLAIPLGAIVGCIPRFQSDWLQAEFRHGVMAFGGGVLLSAVALVLVPEGAAALPIWAVVAAMTGGGGAFLLLDAALQTSGASMAQLTAMLADFIPEAIALGGICATGDPATALLLATMITMQNLPEGFNAYRELSETGLPRRRLMVIFFLLVPLGPLAGFAGLTLLAGHDAVIGVMMLFASGGILYLMFQDIAPQARLERHWLPSLGGVLGFVAGLIGHQVIH